MLRRIVVIMAGGAGERFWPLSRKNLPKQLLPLTGVDSLLETAVGRVARRIGHENIYILTGAHLVGRIRELLPELPRQNVIGEPQARNTAPCLALALAHTGYEPESNTVMGVLTADHHIQNLERFQADLDAAFKAAERGEELVTIGIPPTHPDTGFGYLELGAETSADPGRQIFAVRRFREKPDLETARRFVEAGNYLWNSGMFFWKNSALYAAFEKHLPLLAFGVRRMREELKKGSNPVLIADLFDGLEKVSIDYGLMERADNVVCLRAEFAWDDVGTWEALARVNPRDDAGNVVRGDAVVLDAKDSIICAGNDGAPLIAALGVDNLIIVAARDAVLICPRQEAQRVKEIVAELKNRGREELL